jgi:hypothetical protein
MTVNRRISYVDHRFTSRPDLTQSGLIISWTGSSWVINCFVQRHISAQCQPLCFVCCRICLLTLSSFIFYAVRLISVEIVSPGNNLRYASRSGWVGSDLNIQFEQDSNSGDPTLHDWQSGQIRSDRVGSHRQVAATEFLRNMRNEAPMQCCSSTRTQSIFKFCELWHATIDLLAHIASTVINPTQHQLTIDCCIPSRY